MRLQGNLQGNSEETFRFQREAGKETTIINDNISALPEVTDWRPEAKVISQLPSEFMEELALQAAGEIIDEMQ